MRINLRFETGVPASDEDLARLSAAVAEFCPFFKLLKHADTTVEEECVSASTV